MEPLRPTISTIDLDALRANVELLRRRALPGQALLCAVKAQAYGHGLVPVARALADASVEWLGVALVEEGIALRQAGVELPALVLGGFPAGAEDAALEAELTPTLYDLSAARRLNAAAARRGQQVAVHLKIDTGMGRLGVPFDRVEAFLDQLVGLEHLRVDGLMSHLSESEAAEPAFTELQLDRFDAAVATARSRGLEPRWIHAANSGALLGGRQRAGYTLARSGISLYGCPPDDSDPAGFGLRPVLSLRTRALFVKDVPAGTPVSYGRTWTTQRPSRLATLPIGYGDGWLRSLSGRAQVLVRGRRVPLVGRVCMDLCVVDVTDVPGVEAGEPVVLIGEQGGERVTACEVARWAGTISYEVTCALHGRIPRRYRGSGAP